MNSIIAFSFIAVSAFLNAATSALLKEIFNKLGSKPFTKILEFRHFYLAVFLYALAPVFWFLALHRIELSIGIPSLLALQLLFVLLFGIFWLREPWDRRKALGISLIITSLVFFYGTF